ncbi:MAG: helix-turn-helix transcriptional regulator [Oscillospiraceae bacterium]|nr:helix-turn-helix transcriptional regulator [Oscillospiraceae bacterium]
MEQSIAQRLSALRRQRRLSQRGAAAELGVSQALLSHYENGIREPGLAFVRRACDFYGVTADYLLGRSELPNGPESTRRTAQSFLERLRALTDRAEQALGELSGGEDDHERTE